MTKINLLPWREELRKQQQQIFVNVLALSVLLTCLIFASVYQYIEGRIDYQKIRNSYLETQIAEVDKKIKEIKAIKEKRKLLRKKIEVIEDLQMSRTEIVHVFDELRKITPEGIYLTDFIQLGDKLTLKGWSKANSEVSALMDAIVNSKWIDLDGNGLKTIDSRKLATKGKESQITILAKQIKTKDKKKGEGDVNSEGE